MNEGRDNFSSCMRQVLFFLMLPPQKIFSWIIQSLQHYFQPDSTCMPFSDKVSKKVLLGEKGGRGKKESFIHCSAQYTGPSLVMRYRFCVCTQSCLTLWDPMDCSPPGSSVHGIFQERILEWVAISYSRASSWPRNWTWVSCISCIGREILYHWAT